MKYGVNDCLNSICLICTWSKHTMFMNYNLFVVKCSVSLYIRGAQKKVLVSRLFCKIKTNCIFNTLLGKTTKGNDQYYYTNWGNVFPSKGRGALVGIASWCLEEAIDLLHINAPFICLIVKMWICLLLFGICVCVTVLIVQSFVMSGCTHAEFLCTERFPFLITCLVGYEFLFLINENLFVCLKSIHPSVLLPQLWNLWVWCISSPFKVHSVSSFECIMAMGDKEVRLQL